MLLVIFVILLKGYKFNFPFEFSIFTIATCYDDKKFEIGTKGFWYCMEFFGEFVHSHA